MIDGSNIGPLPPPQLLRLPHADQRRHSELETLLVGEFDEEVSPLGAKGLGEPTAVWVAPAIANAVYHATGKRIRNLPVTIEKLL